MTTPDPMDAPLLSSQAAGFPAWKVNLIVAVIVAAVAAICLRVWF